MNKVEGNISFIDIAACAVTDCAECDTTADTCTTCASGYFLDSAACAVGKYPTSVISLTILSVKNTGI